MSLPLTVKMCMNLSHKKNNNNNKTKKNKVEALIVIYTMWAM